MWTVGWDDVVDGSTSLDSSTFSTASQDRWEKGCGPDFRIWGPRFPLGPGVRIKACPTLGRTDRVKGHECGVCALLPSWGPFVGFYVVQSQPYSAKFGQG